MTTSQPSSREKRRTETRFVGNLRERPSTRTRALVAITALSCLGAASSSARHSAARTAVETTAGSTAGVVEVHASVDEIHGLLRDVRAWPRVFSDIEEVDLLDERGGKTVARVVSRLMGHGHTISIASEGGALVQLFVLDAGPGGALTIDFQLEPLDAGVVRVKQRLSATLPFPFQRFFDEATLRPLREKKVLCDLEDLRRFLDERGERARTGR